MERKLASLQIVDNIINHENSNNLNIATVLGWKVVITKNEVLAGERCIYLEIDSVIPIDNDKYPEWCPPALIINKVTRIKTIKIRNKISQGLIINYNIVKMYLLNKLLINENDFEQLYGNIGTDYTQLLNITKWISPTDLDTISSNVNTFKKLYPIELVPKTDEKRIQSNPDLLQKLYGNEYWGTLKIDGCSSTFLMIDSQLTVCSRNEIKKYNANDLYWKIAIKYNIENILRNNQNYAIQGEIYGYKIQKNLLNIKCQKLYVFSIYDCYNKQYLNINDTIEFCLNNNLDMVPIIYHGTFFNETIDSLLEKSKGFYPNTRNHQEGIVWINYNKTISFKSINNDYLLKYQ